MTADAVHFDVFPKVVAADSEAEITIRPEHDAGFFRADRVYEVTYFPCEEIARRSGWPAKNKPPARLTAGALMVRQFFEAEQEHLLLVEEVAGDKRVRVGEFRVYSVASDLFARRPFKGDFHIHSNRSDGRESPAYVAGACRRIGMDLMAVTDHGRYAPSIEAQAAYSGVDIDLAIYPGEEVHPPDNPAHMINFGGRFSVNDLFLKKDEYSAAVAAVEKKLGALPEGVDRRQYASCLWTFDRIREGGGLAIFCHPYWFYEHRYTPSAALTAQLLEAQPYDAFELIGGYHKWEAESNALQVARYHEERSQGRKVPIVGSSDAHGCERGELFGWYYTIVFAASAGLPDIIEGVKGLYSVAVEALPGETPRAHGPFRLVKYAMFLMREVFPRHDALCVEEGRLMLAHANGEPEAAEALAGMRGRTKRLYERMLGGR
jgi:hypothetical protein